MALCTHACSSAAAVGRLGYHRRPARADTGKTLNFVAKAPTALAHANFTMLRRRTSPTCPNHPPRRQALATQPALLLEIRRRSKLHRWLFRVRAAWGHQDSLMRSWDVKEKPFRCSTGRRMMHLRFHSRQSPELFFLHSTSQRVTILT